MSNNELSTHDDGRSSTSGATSSNVPCLASDNLDNISVNAHSAAATQGSPSLADVQCSPVVDEDYLMCRTPDKSNSRKRPSVGPDPVQTASGSVKRSRPSLQGMQICSLAAHVEYPTSASTDRVPGLSVRGSDAATDDALPSYPVTPTFPSLVGANDSTGISRGLPANNSSGFGLDDWLVSEAIYKLIPEEEKRKVTKHMMDKGHVWPQWPKLVFSKYYIAKGCHEVLVQYSISILEAAKVENQIKQAHFNHQGGPDSSDEHDEERNRLRKKDEDLDRALRKRKILYQGSTWDQVEIESVPKSDDLSSIFPELTLKMVKELVDDVPRFPAKDKDPEKSDYWVWIDHIKYDLSAQPTHKANYILLRRVGPSYTTSLIDKYNHSLRGISNEVLLHKLGTEVYRLQQRNPISLAFALKLGTYGCTNDFELYTRVVNLHYCRGHGLTDVAFIVEATEAIGIKISEADGQRDRWYQEMLRSYPSLANHMQELDVGAGSASWSERIDALQAGGLPFPDSPATIRDYLRLAVVFACRKSTSQLSKSWQAKHVRLAEECNAKLKKGGDKKALPADIKKATVKVKASPPAEEKAATKKVPREANQTDDDKKDKAVAKKDRVCTTCGKAKHTAQFCYTTFPELKEEHAKKRLERKEKKAAEEAKATKVVSVVEVTGLAAGKGDFQ